MVKMQKFRQKMQVQNIQAGDTITLNGKTYEFVKDTNTDPTTKGATAIVVGVDNNATLTNLNKALENTGIKGSEFGKTIRILFSRQPRTVPD